MLVKWVPSVKRSMETVLFKIREVLAIHGAAASFWMRSLKHKNLEGDVIASHRVDSDSSAFESEEEEEVDILQQPNALDVRDDPSELD